MASKLVGVVLPALCGVVLLGSAAQAAATDEERSLTELRNTVLNLLQGLVEKGILTREQAQAMVADAQAKAAAEATAKAEQQKQQDKADEGAVRVPYVPQIVKDQIAKEVVAELQPKVTEGVVAQVRENQQLRSALPDWVNRMHWYGDVRVRTEGDDFARDNIQNSYLDFQAINTKGGIGKAGDSAYLNVSENRDRLRLRLRFGFDTDLGSGFSSGMSIATGTGETYVSTNQTLGTYGGRYQIALDQGYIRWTGATATDRQILTTTAGRFANPWLSSDMVWYNDLTFEGVAANYRFNLFPDRENRHDVFATIGAFPLQDVTPSSDSKWLAGGQIGADLKTAEGSRLRVGAAYYDYIRIAGERNSPESTLLNFTAPLLLQKGNTLYDISNTADRTVNLFALAANYRIVDLIAMGDLRVFSRYAVTMNAEAVKNIGYKTSDVFARTGTYVPARTLGYQAGVGFGSAVLGERNTWRATVAYRYLQRDAVLDAFNDQDFHLGGTDAKGYMFTLDYNVNPRVWTRLRYLSANEIDGLPLGVDVWQVDLNTRF
jgi:polyhydroxyalkanoate synthesis regulator phasin